MTKQHEALFSHHEHALEKEYESCPKCSLSLQIRHSKHGPFLGCTGYPACDYSRPLVEHENMEHQIIAGSVCPECSHELAIKKGRYGIFIGCANYPECKHIEHTEDEEEVIDCPECKKGHITQRVSRYGKTFYACDSYPKCKFAVNYHPVVGECEKCRFGLLVERKMSGEKRLVCAKKSCGHKQS